MANLSHRDEVWACEFFTDALAHGRSVRMIALMIKYSREYLAAEAGVSYRSMRVRRVRRVLDDAAEARGRYPACLRTDNSCEFVDGALTAWS